MSEVKRNSAVDRPQLPTRKNFRNLTGQPFGRLTVTHFVGMGRRGAIWGCVCDCGKTRDVLAVALLNKQIRNCGGHRSELAAAANRTHGLSKTAEYQVWCHMVQRCTNPKVRNYKDYGGRGITICDRWRNSFADFLADMGKLPGPGYELDRIDNDGNYEPTNCRWATVIQNQRNKRTSRIIEFNGLSMSAADWAERTGIRGPLICGRLDAGWSIEQALTTPSGTKRVK